MNQRHSLNPEESRQHAHDQTLSKDELIAALAELRTKGTKDAVATATASAAGTASSALDLAAERTMRIESERLGRIKDEFLANLSHELRTPLTAIMGWSQLLKPGKTSDAQMAEGLAVIQRSVRVQAQLIGDLLDMSRIISGKMRLDVQRVELPRIIEAALESVHLAAEAKGIRVETILDPLAGPVTGDPNRMQQMIWNLLTNAIKFTPKGGKVQITLERTDSHVELSISDTGKGISPEFLPFVFDKFSQAESTVTRTQSGLGLGLAIVKNLVELHGGSVRAKSDGVGKGTTVILSLPISIVRTQSGSDEGQHPTSPREIAMAGHPDLSNIRVMVVDDDADTVKLMQHILEDCGALVTIVTSAADCLALLRESKPSVLIADIGMPVMDGYELIQRIRAMSAEQGGQVPAIALTAFARSEDRRRAMIAGFDVHVAKPVEPGELVAVVARLAVRN